MSRQVPCIYCTEDLHCTKFSGPDYESWCVLGPCTDETPSNGDKFRRMEDEELAAFLGLKAKGCPPSEEDRNACIRVALQTGSLPQAGDACVRCWLNWLGKEAAEEKSDIPSVTALREISGDTPKTQGGGGKLAADSRPYKVVRGHWISEKEAKEMGDIMMAFTCSVCGCCDWDCTESASFKYCPNCGAKMEQEAEP